MSVSRLAARKICVSSRRFLNIRPYSPTSDWSYIHGASPIPYVHASVSDCFLKGVEQVPDRDLFIFKNENIRKSYQDVWHDSVQLSKGLIKLGIRKGDRVGIWGPNYYEWVTTQLATAMAGFILVNINPAYQYEELQYSLRKVGVKALITPPKFSYSDYYSSLTAIIPTLATAKEGVGHIDCHNLPEMAHLIIFGNEKSYRGAWNYTDITNSGGRAEEETLAKFQHLIRLDDPINIQYTSGTTGYPKAATLTHHNIVNNGYFMGLRCNFDKERSIICIPNPLYHCFGCVIGVLNAITHQQTCVFPSPRFNTDAILRSIQEEQCTALYGTPTMFIDVLANPSIKSTNLSALHTGVIAGSPCPAALASRMVNELNLNDLCMLYGTTEASPGITMSYLEDPPEKRIKNVGYVLDHVEVKVIDDDGKTVQRGENGELLARGYNIMRGYWGDEERTKKELTVDGWYHTGDTASMAKDGSISIVGRTKDMIIRGGENIYPTEIETFLFKHPFIEDAQVIGVPDERLGEEVCVWIRLREGKKMTADELKEYCKGKIAHFKIPRYILFKEEKDFPITATGKVKKFELRRLSREELGLEHKESDQLTMTSRR
ncbi:hypothetical protein L596_013292 [Steinernema carpocapsae]|uniref:Medium-chain acyl-CoA ligase ACSF2, mitochondrial n=1 Tax=Steinernema carpocapsae TaxID=34508 RepID=A0A4U5NZS1_STECR|nr:hypothetical protein L596_013292 [Steinernema carpocapsae]